MKRVAVYLRVSTLDQSTDLQKQELLDYLVARQWTDYQIFEDAGRTGTNANRPALKQMLADAKARKIDLVICWKLDRLFRSLKDLVVTLQEFQDLGVEFVSLKDQIDLTTASGRLLMQLLGAMAEFEGSLIRERVRAGIRAAKAKGQQLGRPTRIDQARAFSLRAEGPSLATIAKTLGATKSGVSKTLRKLGTSTTHVGPRVQN